MKFISLSILFLLATVASHATIIRANNNSAVLGTYTTVQAAHNAASPGDTIHIETSVTSYGTVVCTKPLVWIGNGYFQDPSKASYVDHIQCTAGSANSVFIGINLFGDFYIQTNNITVNRCSPYTITLYSATANLCNNFNLSQSFVRNQVTYSSGNSCSGFTFTNNVFASTFQLPTNFSNIVYSHNYFHVFVGGLAVAANNNIFNNTTIPVSIYTTTVYNNLFVGVSGNNTNYVGTNGNILPIPP
jgi:hypothetical protein